MISIKRPINLTNTGMAVKTIIQVGLDTVLDKNEVFHTKYVITYQSAFPPLSNLQTDVGSLPPE